jgi:cytochrome c oxidase assembly factor CtaG
MSVTSFLLDWSFAPSVMLGLALVAALYACGVGDLARRGRFGRVVKRRHVTLFALGLLAVLVALTSPLDTLDERLFTLHMAQHMVLLMVAPPLLLYGKPVQVLLLGAPRELVRAVARAHRRTPWLRGLTRRLTAPVVAWLLYNAGLLLWHLPALYDATLRSNGVHLLEHLYFLGTGLLFWWVIVEPMPGPSRLHPGLRLVYVWAAAIPNALLGMIFATKDTLVYPFYARQQPLWGIAPIDDQHLAGLVMALPGDLIEFVVGAALFFAMMTPDENTLITDAENIAGQASDFGAFTRR